MIMALAVFLLLFCGGRTALPREQANHCLACHTNARKLIEITREIAKAGKDEPEASAETAGHG